VISKSCAAASGQSLSEGGDIDNLSPNDDNFQTPDDVEMTTDFLWDSVF